MNTIFSMNVVSRNKRALVVASAFVFVAVSSFAQSLSTKWEELTGPDFVKAIQQSQGTCLLPIGILEKHGAHLPLGNDLINVRYVSEHAAAEEYAVVFPAYYFGQIFEARQQPGTVAYSSHMQLELMQETADEMARNGCKKIIIVNGHGGNYSLLPYFAQSQLASAHDYIVYVFERPSHDDAAGRQRKRAPARAVDRERGRAIRVVRVVARASHGAPTDARAAEVDVRERVGGTIHDGGVLADLHACEQPVRHLVEDQRLQVLGPDVLEPARAQVEDQDPDFGTSRLEFHRDVHLVARLAHSHVEGDAAAGRAEVLGRPPEHFEVRPELGRENVLPLNGQLVQCPQEVAERPRRSP